MKLAFLRIFMMLAILAPGARAANLEMRITTSADATTVGTAVQYSVLLTNTSNLGLNGISFSVSFPDDLDLTEPRFLDNEINAPTITPTSLTYNIGNMGIGSTARFTLKLTPTRAGSFSIRFSTSGSDTPAETLRLLVGNGQADLGVALSATPPVALAFDLVSYNLFVTNRGPSQAQNIILTNIIPPNAIVVFNSAGTVSSRFSSNQIRWDLGTINASTGRVVTVTIQPLTNGNFPLIAGLIVTNVNDSATADNSVTNQFVVQPLLTNNLVLTRGTLAFNRNTALIEETVTVQNTSSTNMFGGVRILVDGIESPHRLFNTAGTNGLTPYVAHTNTLLAGASVPVKIQYFFKDRQLHPVELTPVQGPIITTNITSTNVTTTNIVATNIVASLTGGGTNTVLNISAASGQTFAIQSSDSVPFRTNATTITNITASGSSISVSNLFSGTNSQRFFRAIQIP